MSPINCLLIEDNPADVFLIRGMLNPGGKGEYQITHAGNLTQGLNILDTEKFDIIISDLGLPDSEGLDTVKSVVNRIKNLPIIVLTSNDSEQVGNESLSIGAQDFLIKGTINSDQLLRAIRYAFRRKNVEAKLRESEEKFRTMVETSPDAVMMFNEGGKIVYASKRAAEVHGYSDEKKMDGSDSHILFAKYEREKIKSRFGEILTKGVIRDEEFMMVREDKSTFFGELSASAITDEHGGISGFLVVTKDISERKNHENAIRLYQQNLRSLTTQLNLVEEKERRKIAVELHDHLGQSLAMAKIRLAVFKNGGLPAGAEENLEEVEKHITHAIDYTRKLTYELSPPVLFELGLVEAIRWKLGQVAETSGINTSFDIKDEITDLNEDFLILIFRSVSELLNNVVAHSGARKVLVTTRMIKNVVAVSVEDDGKGFDPLLLQHSEKSSNKMGLFSVRERLEFFDGSLIVNSRKGGGTRIEIAVPVRVK